MSGFVLATPELARCSMWPLSPPHSCHQVVQGQLSHLHCQFYNQTTSGGGESFLWSPIHADHSCFPGRNPLCNHPWLKQSRKCNSFSIRPTHLPKEMRAGPLFLRMEEGYCAQQSAGAVHTALRTTLPLHPPSGGRLYLCSLSWYKSSVTRQRTQAHCRLLDSV